MNEFRNVDDFDAALLRFKKAIREKTDKAAASLLGLAPTALSERKARGSFPVEKLLSLVATRPYLELDPYFILTGERPPPGVVGENLRRAARVTGEQHGDNAEKDADSLARSYLSLADIRKRRSAQLTSLEALLTSCSDRDFELVMQLAERVYIASLSGR